MNFVDTSNYRTAAQYCTAGRYFTDDTIVSGYNYLEGVLKQETTDFLQKIRYHFLLPGRILSAKACPADAILLLTFFTIPSVLPTSFLLDGEVFFADKGLAAFLLLVGGLPLTLVFFTEDFATVLFLEVSGVAAFFFGGAFFATAFAIEMNLMSKMTMKIQKSYHEHNNQCFNLISYIAAMKLDILAIGVHPDDVELCCAGALVKEVEAGKKVGIVDLTQGELGTRGTVETRYNEAANAAQIMGMLVRENLKMRDGFFKNDEEHQLKLIKVLRKYKPDIVFGNVLQDRHPDHGRAGHLIKDACFLSGLAKIETFNDDGTGQEKWRPRYFFQYMQDWYHEPDLLIDISGVIDIKMKAIEAYTTQFHTDQSETGGPVTYISTPEFKESILARMRMFGKRIGVKYAEGFMSEKQIGLENFNSLILNET